MGLPRLSAGEAPPPHSVLTAAGPADSLAGLVGGDRRVRAAGGHIGQRLAGAVTGLGGAGHGVGAQQQDDRETVLFLNAVCTAGVAAAARAALESTDEAAPTAFGVSTDPCRPSCGRPETDWLLQRCGSLPLVRVLDDRAATAPPRVDSARGHGRAAGSA